MKMVVRLLSFISESTFTRNYFLTLFLENWLSRNGGQNHCNKMATVKNGGQETCGERRQTQSRV